MDSSDSISIKGISGSNGYLKLDKKDSKKERKKSAEEVAAESDAVVLEASLSVDIPAVGKRPKRDEVEELYKSLTLTADEIVAKINEQLKIELPEGVQSLKPEEVTPEATADRIVKGVTAFFDIFAKQNSSLDAEALLNKFMSEIRKGVEQGYGEAIDILRGLGAFEFAGVEEGVRTTKVLIDEKLAVYEKKKREELGLAPQGDEVAESSAAPSSSIDSVA